jgi:hypothetical protein
MEAYTGVIEALPGIKRVILEFQKLTLDAHQKNKVC